MNLSITKNINCTYFAYFLNNNLVKLIFNIVIISFGRLVLQQPIMLSDEDITDLKPQVRVKAMGTDMYFPLPQHDACLGIINGECPLDQGEEVTYQLQMPIQTTFPKVTLPI